MESIHANCPCMETCPLNRALGLIGGKWKMQILCSLHNNGTSRYNALRKSLDGVSNTVLAAALKELEQDGLIARQEYLEVPVRVEYSLTPRAETLMPILEALEDWSMAELYLTSLQSNRRVRTWNADWRPLPAAMRRKMKPR